MAPADSTPQRTAVDYDPFADAPLARVVPATESQREIWLAASLGACASLAYNESVTLHFNTALNIEALARAVQRVADRHDALRGSMSADGLQFCVASAAQVALDRVDLSMQGPAARKAAMDEALRRSVETPFDLGHAPLLRAEILSLAKDEHILLLGTHHIVCDGWSFGVIARELALLYRQECEDARAELPAADSFADFAVAEVEHRQTARFRDDEAFWLSRFASLPAPLDLPLDRSRPRQRSFASRRVDLAIDGGQLSALRRMGATHGASLFAALATVFGVLLQRISQQDDLVIGIPAAGQSDGHEGMVGHAVNVLPLRIRLDPAQAFGDLLKRVRSDLLDAFEHQRYTFGSLLKRLALARDPSRLPLVSVLFNLDPGLDVAALEFDSRSVRLASVARSFENFELFVNAVQVDGGLVFECQYNSDLFDEATITRWLDCYAMLIQSVVADATQSVAALPMLAPAALDELRALQPAATPFDKLRVEALFRRQAALTPDRIAVEWGATRWSYTQLDARARRISHALRLRGVGAGDLVGVALGRHADMLAAVLGVLGSGAGYVPLDPAFPRERLAFMAQDARLALLVTEGAHAGAIDFSAERTLVLDAADALPEVAGSEDPATQPSDCEAIAYVIYTSGSTGKPKGVCVPHRAVANFLSSMRNEPGLAEDDRLLAVTTLSFDIAVLELLLPITRGACVVIATREQTLDGRTLSELIQAQAISMMQATPSTWRMLIESGWSGRSALKALCGGEALPCDLAARLIERCDSLWNMYGPTETTVWSSCVRITNTDAPISIGRPIANTSIAIVDALGAPCPPGVAGEIVIGGAGVTLGYLDRPELTAERFVADPQASTRGARRYRTGDRGRWRNDGLLEHLGRLDFQVKVRGFRIELGDIESNLLRHADVTQAVVIVREDRAGDQRLVAYLTTNAKNAFDESALRNHLRALLPDYMLPQHFVVLDAIPLLPNGKIDRARLPAPQVGQGSQAREHVAPRNELEQRIASAMESALSLPGIGVHEDFFALGGHSLLAAQLTARLGSEFGLKLSLGLLFENPNIESLAIAIGQRITVSGVQQPPAITHLEDPRFAPLSLLQKRLWLFEQLNPGTVVYNTPSAHRLRGELDEAAFQRAFEALVERQSILRTTVVQIGGEVIQRIHEELPPQLFPAEDLSGFAPADREQRLMERLETLTDQLIDLESLPLYRIAMFRLSAQEHVFFFMPHHIIWDGWSFDLFYTEFSELYSAQREKRPPRLAPMPASYGEFSQWHADWLKGPAYSEQFQRELDYWRERLVRTGPPPPLPTDHARGSSLVGRGMTEWISVSRETTERLRALARSADATVFMLLLAAWYAVLWRYVGSSNLVVGTPVRVRASSEVEHVMGLFTNLLPLPVEIDPGENLLALSTRVKASVTRCLASPDVQLEDLMREPGMRELAGTTHFYQAQFSYQDARERICNWGGLAQEQVLIFQRAASEDLAIWFLEHGKGMTGGVLYNADLFEAATARQVAARYLEVLDQVLAAPQSSIAELVAWAAEDVAAARRFTSTPARVMQDGDRVAAGSRASSPATVGEVGAEAMSPSERWLADLWRELLCVSQVSPADNFFDLGGHSLLAMTLVARVEDYSGVRLGILKIANSSLRALAADVPEQAIKPGARVQLSLRERALRMFGIKRESDT